MNTGRILGLLSVTVAALLNSCDRRAEIPVDVELRKEVVRILTYEWNPTQEPPEVLARYDYSAYAPQIVAMIQAGATKQELSFTLFGLETNNMKLNGDRARCDRVAEQLHRIQTRRPAEQITDADALEGAV